MSPPSNEPSAQPLLPFISDDHLLFHARLLVDSWTSNTNNANLFLTEDSRASVINRKLGRPVVAARGTIVHQYIRTATLVNRRLTYEGRPLLCEREFAAALVSLAASPSRTTIHHDAKTRYAGLPDGLLDDWHTRLGELRIYLTSGIVPQGADEHILNKHLAVAATKAPPPRDEKDGVPPLVLSGATDDSTPTSSRHSTSDTSADLKIAEPETSTKKEDATLQPATHSSDPCLSLIVPSSKSQFMDGLRSDGDSAADETASEDSCSAPTELGDIEPKESSPEASNTAVVQVRLPESHARSSFGVSSPPDFLVEVTTKKRASVVLPLPPVISDDALSDLESEYLVDALPVTNPTLVPETSVVRKDTTNVDASKPLLGKRMRDTAVVEDDGETETFIAGLQEEVGSANKRPHLSDSVDTI